MMTSTTQTKSSTKFYAGMVAAFALGAAVSALALGMPQKTYQSAAQNAAMMEPYAGENAGAVIAKVNGRDITMGQYHDFVKTMPEQITAAPIEQVFPMVQDQLVVGTIISGKAGDMENDAEVQKRMAQLRENIIRATWLEREVNAKVTDAAMKKDYDEFVKNFQPADEVKAQHILVADEKTAKDIMTKIAGGAKFDDLVKEFSKDKASGESGDLGYFKQGDMVKEFADAAFAMKAGDVSKTPVKTQFGYHVIKVSDRRITPTPSFEQVQPQIRAKLQREALDTVITDLRNSAKIELFDMNGAPVQAAGAAKEPAKAEPAAGKPE